MTGHLQRSQGHADHGRFAYDKASSRNETLDIAPPSTPTRGPAAALAKRSAAEGCGVALTGNMHTIDTDNAQRGLTAAHLFVHKLT
jgi:hypothetical protein